VIVLSLIVGWGTYERSRSLGEWDLWTTPLGEVIALSASAGAALAAVAYALAKGFELLGGITLYQATSLARPLAPACVSSSPRHLSYASPGPRQSFSSTESSFSPTHTSFGKTV
jgi:hypothetical protein